MDEAEVRAALRDFPLSGLRVYPRVGSTNDEALAWAAGGADDLSLVVADEQTAGRRAVGRHGVLLRGLLPFAFDLRTSDQRQCENRRCYESGDLGVFHMLIVELEP